MALIKCPECGHEVSDKATSCPNCGYPMQKNMPLNKTVSIKKKPCEANKPLTSEEKLQNFQSRYDQLIAKSERAAEEESRSKAIKCPNCGSTDTIMISTVSKVFSFSFIGPASRKFCKNYKCKHCGYIW